MLPGASTLGMLSRMDAWWDRDPCHRAGGQWVSEPWCSCLYGWIWLSSLLLPSAIALASAERGCSGNLAAAQRHEPASPLNQILSISVSIPGVASSSPSHSCGTCCHQPRHADISQTGLAPASLRIPVCRWLSMVSLAGYLAPSNWGRDNVELPQLSSIQVVGSSAGLCGQPWCPAEGKEGIQLTFGFQQCHRLYLPWGKHFGLEVALAPQARCSGRHLWGNWQSPGRSSGSSRAQKKAPLGGWLQPEVPCGA